jgi:hypothetical protein
MNDYGSKRPSVKKTTRKLFEEDGWIVERFLQRLQTSLSKHVSLGHFNDYHL